MVAPVSLLPQGDARLIDRYQLVGEIASGGMASVFLGRLAGVGGFQRFVAIKRLHPHLANEERFIQMFMDEARLAASIHHKNVVPILEIGNSADGYYLVMEYIEGATVGKLMSRASATKEPLPRSVLLRIIMDTLSGLEAAHQLKDEEGKSLGVVHRDVSPANILVGLDGCTRLTDFGIARAASRLANTREGALKGKLSYMAPEQTQGEDFDHRADIFSAGVVMWEVLMGRRLFRGKTEAATLKRLLQEPIPRLSDKLEVSQALDDICAQALERDPSARFQSAAAMVQALEEAARASGDPDAIASERTVAKLMRSRFDTDVSEQRQALRSWLQATPTLLDRSRPRVASWAGETGSGVMAAVPMAADGDEDSLSAGGGMGHVSITPPSVAADVVIPTQPRQGGRWLALALLLLVGGVAAAMFLGDREVADGDDGAAPQLAPKPAAAAPAAAGDSDGDTTPSATAVARDGADGAPQPSAQPSASASAAAKPRRPRKPSAGGDLDDLSNPYR